MRQQVTAIQITSTTSAITVNTSNSTLYTSNDISSIFQYLLSNNNTIYVAWDLDETVSHLLRKLPKSNLIELQKTAKTTYKDHRLFYIMGKLFSITTLYSYTPVNIYHLEQYFPEYEPPKSLQETLDMANQILEALKIMKLQSSKLSSPVAIYEDAMLNHLQLPTIKNSNITKQAAEYAYNCSGKLWIEAFKIGHFEQVYDYDLSGAFPTFAKQMIDITDASWLHNKEYNPKATYGFCRGYVTINKNIKVSPIIYENEAGELSNPTGTWMTYLTKHEIDFINKWKIGHFDIEDGWWCYCKNINKRPLENVCNRLLEFKKHENKLVRLLAKRMSVGGLYGKFGEEFKEKFGKHFNPVYFAMISTLCRLEVANFIYTNKLEDNLIHISVDGILIDRRLELDNQI